jgi:hypothetical protein
VAAAGEDDETRERQIAVGLRVVESCHAPIEAWRLHALAGESEKSGSILRELVGSLADEPDLSKSLLASPQVARVLSRGKPTTV